VPLLSSLNPCTWSLDLDLLTTQELPKSTPSLLARLPRLQELKLRNINGTLPEEFIGARHTNFRRLGIMAHYGGPLQGWISPHGDLPLSLGELSSLKSLTVRNCAKMDMSRLSDILSRLLKLEILDLKNIGLSSIPSSVANLTELTVLRLYDNKIVGNIPAGLLGLTKLTSLWLHQNKFTGSIPEFSVESLKDITLCVFFFFLSSSSFLFASCCLYVFLSWMPC
jgi:Leucine-rich repeat (LRR) protein